MGRKPDFPDKVSAALMAELKRRIDCAPKERSTDKGYRTVGVALGFPRDTASQVIGAAIKSGRVGNEIADGLKKALESEGVAWESFLSTHGIHIMRESLADRVLRLAAKVGCSALIAEEVKNLMAPDASDDEIEQQLRAKDRMRAAVQSHTGRTPTPPLGEAGPVTIPRAPITPRDQAEDPPGRSRDS